MNTRTMMTTSAIVLAVLGLGATFLPQELLGYVGAGVTPAAVLLIQLMGALYIGFAALNWMSRGFITGGIYGRPLIMANLAHFMVGAIALLKAAFTGPSAGGIVLVAAPYSVLAAWFAMVLFRHPAGEPGAAGSAPSARRP